VRVCWLNHHPDSCLIRWVRWGSGLARLWLGGGFFATAPGPAAELSFCDSLNRSRAGMDPLLRSGWSPELSLSNQGHAYLAAILGQMMTCRFLQSKSLDVPYDMVVVEG
jgi:hypothetical protein